MENLIFSFNVVAPLLIIMVMGYISKCIRFVSEDFLNQLNRFVFNFCLPIMLFQNIKFSCKENSPDRLLFYIIICGIILTIFFSVLIVPMLIKKKTKRCHNSRNLP
ncbi:MAG: AEC family transporter [Bacteroidales bacterium OttesenSCG-928-I14]|jgi:predicted permease|nr:AEC family transporter [Bacteroidales bacterium OttesenSCG-928-I14]